MRWLVLIVVCAALAGCKKDKRSSGEKPVGTETGETELAEDKGPPAWAAAGDGSSSGFFCYEFSYDGKPRWHCEPSEEECAESQKRVQGVGSDLGKCTLSAEAHCFTVPDTDPVCSPTADICNQTRSERARMATQYVTQYSGCQQVTNKNFPGALGTAGDAGPTAADGG